MMKISFLLPSKNRLDLLKHAIKSITDQVELDFEIIVSDNASSEDYHDYISSLKDHRVIYFRHSDPVPVTVNWSKALSLASGDYILMLGDDDALAPAFSDEVRSIVTQDSADLIYLAAYHYGYPGVFSPGDNGYMAKLWWEFVQTGDGPSCLMPDYRRELARSVISFQHRFGYNAQHFLLKKSFVDSFLPLGGLYQSPYPDFFSAMLIFNRASNIIVVPTESVIIGISPKSFGAYYVSQREDEGYNFLDNKHVNDDVRDFLHASAFPGDFNNTNWLISAEMARRAAGVGFEAPVDIDRYQIIQILQLLRDQILHGKPRDGAFAEVARRLSRREGMLLDMLKVALDRAGPGERTQLFSAMARVPDQYPPSGYSGLVDIGQHRNIADAIAWLRGVPSDVASGDADAIRGPESPGDPGRSPFAEDDRRSVPEIAPVPEIASAPLTAPGARIVVARAGGEIVLMPEDLDAFAFLHGDELSVEGLEGVEHAIAADRCVHFRATDGRAMRVPAVVGLARVRDFDIEEHLARLAGGDAGAPDGGAHAEGYGERIGLFPDMTFLGINTGIGRDALQILEGLGGSGRYIGVDVRREVVVWGRRNIAPSHPNASFHQLDVRHELYNPLGAEPATGLALPIETGSVDRASLGSTLTCLLEDEASRYLDEIRRVLRTDGKAYAEFFLYSPETIDSVHRTGASTLRFEHPHAPGCFVQDAGRPTRAVSFTDEAVRRMLARAGLELAGPYVAGSWSGRSKTARGMRDAFVVAPSKRSFLKSVLGIGKR